MRDRARYSRMRREARIRRRLMPVVGLGGSTIAVLVVTLPSLFGGRSASARAERLAYITQGARLTRPTAGESRPAAVPQVKRLPPAAPVASRVTTARRPTKVDRPATAPAIASTTTTRSVATAAATMTRPATAAKPAAPVAAAADTAGPATIAQPAATTAPVTTATPSTSTSPGYVNPLAHASVTPERIDQGVDYRGTGDLSAIGDGQITYVATSGTGWPGAFIEFRLADGPDAGRYVFYAEGIVPAAGLQVGQTIRAGQKLATLTGGIEIGWGAGVGTETYAMKAGQWRSGMDGNNAPTASGKSFSALIALLGAPPGKIEG